MKGIGTRVPFDAPQGDESLVEALFASIDPREILVATARGLGELLSVSVCVAVDLAPNGEPRRPPVEWSAVESLDLNDADGALSCTLFRRLVQIGVELDGPVFVPEAATHPFLADITGLIRTLRVESLGILPTFFQGSRNGIIVLYERRLPRVWSPVEVLAAERVARYVGIALHQAELSAARTAQFVALSASPLGRSACVFRFDVEGRLISANEQFQLLFGSDPSRSIGSFYSDIIRECVPAGERERVERWYAAMVEEGRATAPIEHRVINRQTGRVSSLVIQFSDVIDASGARCGFEAVAVDVSELRETEERLYESDARYRRLVEHSDAVIFHTDPSGVITFISRRGLDFFGVAPEDFVSEAKVTWFDLVHPDDIGRVRISAARFQRAETSFDDEFRVVNRVTGSTRWLFVRFVPVHGRNRELTGWDGFGVDITERREAQEALDQQTKKIRALYTVSASIRGFLEPSSIATRGLLSLCDAASADAGVCFLYTYPPAGGRALQLVARHGFSSEASERAGSLLSLATQVVESNQPVVIPDILADLRVGRALYEEEGLRSAVVVPICAEDERLGAMGIFSRSEGRFDGSDVMLVSAAANQIGLAARQANLFSAYRKQTKNLSALYRMSHELSRELSPEDIFQQAFAILRDELGLKRIWLGLLDETSTRIVGQAAYGPGFKRRLVEINVEIRGREHPIARVVANRTPLVIDNPKDVLRELGLRKVFARLGIQSMALVPLIARGQVLGVLAIQPRADELALDNEELTLLSSLANEIATILLTKRLEDRIQASEKMRTASLLAAGIAHNFNNLLQAILGQASLLDIQASEDPRVARAVRVINEAASRGAELVKQLLSFAHLEEPQREVCEVNDILERSRESLVKSAGPAHRLTMNLTRNLPRVYIDPGQFLRVMTSLVTNAGESMPTPGFVEIFTDSISVDEDNPHFEVPYGNYVRIGVRDNGVGMAEEIRRRCFEPFFTTKNVDPASGLGLTGAGLGLAAAYAIARRNGGQLVVESRPGAGSLFTLYVPVFRERSRRSPLSPQKRSVVEPSEKDVAAAPPSSVRGVSSAPGETLGTVHAVEKVLQPGGEEAQTGIGLPRLRKWASENWNESA